MTDLEPGGKTGHQLCCRREGHGGLFIRLEQLASKKITHRLVLINRMPEIVTAEAHRRRDDARAGC
jgi:hypothetical protein